MNDRVEKRLHRVKIQLKGADIKCPYSNECGKSIDGKRCNKFYKKCAIYIQEEMNKSFKQS
ncbi:MAG: hypothetical protein BAJALOKI3v1_520022 [Promethearchaeota archaeon]|jgi:hypothetical protein|nr:MAG: hypothetical protein BAJALOKI3v1_520022 [Candidatus Lokiarchaeota archaeon]